MSKGKRPKAARPLPELQDGAATSNGPSDPAPRAGSSDRLPSLWPKRDLTLGGTQPQKTQKKTFAPTIPVRRKKAPSVPVPSVTDEGTSRERKRGAERRERGRGRGRGGKRDRDVVTSASVFSMGPAERLMQKRESMGETFGNISRSEKSDSIKVRSEDRSKYRFQFSGDEEEDAKEMEVGGEQMFAGSKLPPVQLPLDYSLHTRQKSVISRAKAKLDLKESATAAPVKPVKPAVLESSVDHPRMKAARLFSSSEGSKGQFLFFQLPDCVPVEAKGDGVAMDTTTTTQTQSAATCAASTNVEKEKEQKASQGLPSLRDLPDGLIGKLQVHESGKVKLVLGDNTLDIAMGTPCGFLQELVSIRTEQERPQMVALGQMLHRLIITPDFESLLDSDRTVNNDCDTTEEHR